MPRTFCIANQKGGVGKTTTAINLAAGLAWGGYRVLLIDLDPQCNATSGLGSGPVERHPLTGAQPLRHSIVKTAVEGLDLLPGSRSIRDVDSLVQRAEAERDAVVAHLQSGTGLYDFVLLDCPPSISHLTQTALAASNEVLMPIQCEYFAMEGLTQMISVIRNVMHTQTTRLEFGGILLTMYDDGLELAQEVEAEVREFFGEIVFSTVIPRDVAVCEAPSHAASVLDYAPRSRGARAYMEVCMEVLDSE